MEKLTYKQAQKEWKDAIKQISKFSNIHAKAILIRLNSKESDLYLAPEDFLYTKEEIWGKIVIVVNANITIVQGINQERKINEVDPRSVKQALEIWKDWIKTGGDHDGKRIMAKDTRAAYELLKKENVL